MVNKTCASQEANTRSTLTLFVIDDDPATIKAIDACLHDTYRERFRIVSVSSDKAITTLQELHQRDEPVAILMVNHELPGTLRVELLTQAHALFPDAHRILYTTSTDALVAVDGNTQNACDAYLLQPWHDPETALYPILDDALDDWETAPTATVAGIIIIGDRWSPQTHEVKDFLARNRVPYRWLDIETSDEARRLLSHTGLTDARLPILLFADGTHLVQPTDEEVAEKIGFSTVPSAPFYDLIIIGGGPSGLAAAVYGASEGLRVIIVEREALGGQAGTSSQIENYLGFPEGLSGADLTRRAVEQATRFGVEVVVATEVKGLRVAEPYRVVTFTDGAELSCHTILLATGVTYRRLDVPGADQLTGAGIYYGAAGAEALACREQEVCLLGGGNSAGQAALHLAQYAHHVTIVTRATTLADTMSHYLVQRIESTDNISVRSHATISEAHGSSRLEGVTIRDLQSGAAEMLVTNALFVWIGGSPHTNWLADTLELDEDGFILTGWRLTHNGRRSERWPLERDPYLLEASTPGVFAVGDVRAGSVKRIAAAVGEGSMAVQFIHAYLQER